MWTSHQISAFPLSADHDVHDGDVPRRGHHHARIRRRLEEVSAWKVSRRTLEQGQAEDSGIPPSGIPATSHGKAFLLGMVHLFR